MRRLQAVIGIVLAFAVVASAVEPPKFKEALVVAPTGSGARAVVSPDPVAAAVVAGNWVPPKAGDSVKAADGSTKPWESAEVADDGWLRHASLRGGYAYVPVTCDVEQVVLLETVGHGIVYVNGEPRAGDPYQYGYVRLPVLLKAGRNDLLFRGSRGDFKIGFKAPEAPLAIDLADATLPDVIEGTGGAMLGGVVVINATNQWMRGAMLISKTARLKELSETIDPMPPLSMRKVPFQFEADAQAGEKEVALSLRLQFPGAEGKYESSKAVETKLRVRKPAESRRVTFRSEIDQSVQYYMLRPAVPADGKTENLAMILSLHGASVEAVTQCDSYISKPWASIVCPTNRRPFGFDWEDWGRLDAMEVFDLAQSALKPDPHRLFLTGHSMGGHGTWQLGAHFADKFAAIAPSAGWISFWSYTGAEEYKGAGIEAILKRATTPSDTLALLRNYKELGIYILHGDADDNVPVDQARQMRAKLGGFHGDFAYYERPGAGHWWGNECMDWPPLMDFLNARRRKDTRDIRRVDFALASPGVSATSGWVTVEAQVRPLAPSSVTIDFNPGDRSFKGSTQNTARMTIDLSSLIVPRPVQRDGKSVDEPTLEPGKPLTIELDSQKLADVPWPTAQPRITLYREGDQWRIGGWAPATLKGPNRSGPFKDAFRNGMVFVVGTGGTDEERAVTLQRARLDAETFWYRGNGSIPIILDTEFDVAKDPARNVILYGNADTNAAWQKLLADSPVQVRAGSIQVGDKSLAGVDLACLLVRPRPGSDKACVGAIAGTGPAGLRLTQRVPYFVSGVSIPDWLIIGPEAMQKGVGGVLGAGFFGNDWGLSAEDTAWKQEPAPKSGP